MNAQDPTKTFEDQLEAYLDGTLSAEEAQKLLQTLEADPELRQEFCDQVRTARLVEAKANPSTDDVQREVMKRLREATHGKSGWRLLSGSRVLQVAAALVIAAILAGMFLPSLGTSREKARRISRISRDKMAEVKRKMAALDGRQDHGKATLEEELGQERFTSVSRPQENLSRENYAKIVENTFKAVREVPLSTFSIDVDTASYANVRRFLASGRLPPKDAVRVEELVNYFTYNYEPPTGEDPFSASMALRSCPWNPAHHLLRIGLQGREIDTDRRKPSNLVFLLDVSGSMNQPNKLPLLKQGMEMLVRNLGENDRVAIVVYAGSSGLVLDSTSAMEKETILGAMNRLSAGGSTAGGAGIQLAYQVAQDHFIKDGVNRVILATDGDFNVGVSSHGGLRELIEEKRRSGVFLSVLGFGTGNIQDSKMELLANKGNGNYYYIDSRREARKVLVEQMNATLVTIAKDVKIQVEFNPHFVTAYRLVGYENRKLAARDFDDDTKDAGEIGAGHRVTALYELVPPGAPETHEGEPLKYRKPDPTDDADNPLNTTEILTLKLRYKQPDGETSKQLTFPLSKRALGKKTFDADYQWAAAVAAFGQILRGSQYVQSMTLADVKAMAAEAAGEDPGGYRREFLALIDRAIPLLDGREPAPDSKYPTWQYRR